MHSDISFSQNFFENLKLTIFVNLFVNIIELYTKIAQIKLKSFYTLFVSASIWRKKQMNHLVLNQSNLTHQFL